MDPNNDIPVYLFVGFLESGKTKFIQESSARSRSRPTSTRTT